MIEDPEQKIGRPRQLYIGATERPYVPIDRRAVTRCHPGARPRDPGLALGSVHFGEARSNRAAKQAALPGSDASRPTLAAARWLRGRGGPDRLRSQQPIASQRPFRSRVVRRRSSGARACARSTSSTSQPGDWAQERPARSRPHLPGRLFGQHHRPWPSARPRLRQHPGPALTLGRSVHHARRGVRTAAPGSWARGAVAASPRVSSPRPRRKPHPAAPVMLRIATSSTRKTYPRPLLRTGIDLSARGSPKRSSVPRAPWMSARRTSGSERHGNAHL